MGKKFEKQPRARVGMNNMIHFLHKTTLSRLEEVPVFSNAQKSTERIKKTKEQEYFINKRIR